tara:strand:+ start:765 stop:932 length:168 start_codon:yes stop_codon:yes gene_type:complete
MDELKVKQLVELKELLEDTIEYYCDENMVSGESAWTMVGALADAKLSVEFNEITS